MRPYHFAAFSSTPGGVAALPGGWTSWAGEAKDRTQVLENAHAVTGKILHPNNSEPSTFQAQVKTGALFTAAPAVDAADIRALLRVRGSSPRSSGLLVNANLGGVYKWRVDLRATTQQRTRVDFTDSGSTSTQADAPVRFTTGDGVWLRVLFEGRDCRMKLWQYGAPEPHAWYLALRGPVSAAAAGHVGVGYVGYKDYAAWGLEWVAVESVLSRRMVWDAREVAGGRAAASRPFSELSRASV